MFNEHKCYVAICTYTNFILLYVVPPPVVISDPVDTLANNGSNIMFNCTSFSYESISYTWLKNGNTILSDSDKFIISSNHEGSNTFTITLMILDVQLSDNGVYVCNVTNREGTTLSNAATLSVIGTLHSCIFGCCKRYCYIYD